MNNVFGEHASSAHPATTQDEYTISALIMTMAARIVMMIFIPDPPCMYPSGHRIDHKIHPNSFLHGSSCNRMCSIHIFGCIWFPTHIRSQSRHNFDLCRYRTGAFPSIISPLSRRRIRFRQRKPMGYKIRRRLSIIRIIPFN